MKVASRKKFLPEDEIQGLERMTGQQRSDHLSGLPREGVEKLLNLMLNSYRIAARTANAAARQQQCFRDSSVDAATHGEALEQLERCLADYMPNQFSPHAGELESLCDELKIVWEEGEGMSKEELMDFIEARYVSYEEQLKKINGRPGEQLTLPARTPVT